MNQAEADEAAERRTELAAFLKDMRARTRPEEAGLQPGRRRRVKGLRREEVAALAAISTTWYIWLEQGRDVTASPRALERLAQALQLNRVERAYLFRLARPTSDGSRDQLVTKQLPSPSLQALIDGLHPRPAYVLDPIWNIVAWNDAANRLLGGFTAGEEDEQHQPSNVLIRMFLDEHWRRLFDDWKPLARSVVAQFRAATSGLAATAEHKAIVETLQCQSPEFADAWRQTELAEPQSWQKTLTHPVAGRMTFNYVTLACQNADRGCWISIYTPASDADEAAMGKLLIDNDGL